MDKKTPLLRRVPWIPALFCIYLALTLFGWICIVINSDTVMPLAVRGLVRMSKISALLALAAGGVWALTLLFRYWQGKPAVNGARAAMAAATVALLPLFFFGTIGVLLIVPFWVMDWMTPERSKTLRSAKSPDGQWTAYVIRRPRFDARADQLYLKHAGDKEGRRVARLKVEADGNRTIHWSPRSDLVVFNNSAELYALRTADMKYAVAPLGGRKVVSPNRTYALETRGWKEAEEISFPKAGGVGYQIKGSNEKKRIPPDEFEKIARDRVIIPYPPSEEAQDWEQFE